MLQYAAYSHIGAIRENNEDNLYMNGQYKENVNQSIIGFNTENSGNGIFAVFDGMGGESSGELAAHEAARILDGFGVEQLISEPMIYINKANLSICNNMVKDGRERAGTTAALLLIKNGIANILNIGDSRIYRLKNSRLEQLSVDHTRLQRMLDAGVVFEETAEVKRFKHVLTQHLGVHPDEYIIEPYICENISVHDGDIFLLCSDGLTDMLSDNDIESVLLQNESAEILVGKLIAQALKAGGKDNITVIVVKAEFK